jgi:hypothetical protein
MGYAIETVLGYLSNAASTGAQSLTAASGQSFNVRATNGQTTAHLEAVWGYFQDPGFLRIRSPRLHDDVIGIELQGVSTNPSPLADEYFEQTLYSQDSLTVEGYFTSAPTSTHYTGGALQVYYDDLPGVAGNFVSWAEVKARVQSYMGVYVSPTSSATVGQWGAGVALNSSQDVFKANGAYALIGYTTPTTFTSFSILGSDLGNLNVGGPGSTDPIVTRRFFPWMEETSGRPSIPVINSQNKASTLVYVAGPTASTAYPISLLFAYLGQVSGS